MKHKIFALVAVAMVAVAGVNVYKVSASEVEMSDLQKENVEALASYEITIGRLCCTSEPGKCDYGDVVFDGRFVN